MLILDTLKGFPIDEKFTMSSQLRRASLSISNNIAEGCGREGAQSLSYFLSVSYGSLKEVESMLFIARQANYMTEQEYSLLYSYIIELSKMLSALIKKIKSTN